MGISFLSSSDLLSLLSSKAYCSQSGRQPADNSRVKMLIMVVYRFFYLSSLQAWHTNADMEASTLETRGVGALESVVIHENIASMSERAKQYSRSYFINLSTAHPTFKPLRSP